MSRSPVKTRTMKSLFLSLLAITLALISTDIFSVEKMTKLSEAENIAEFSLQDGDGNPFGLSDFRGKWNLVSIGFTSCPDICPFVLSNLKAVIKKVDPDNGYENLRSVFVAIDPQRDKAILKDYVSHFGDNVIGITGKHAELKKFVKNIGGNYIIENSSGKENYDVKHSAFVVLISPEGKVVAKFNPPLPSDETSLFISNIMAEFHTASR